MGKCVNIYYSETTERPLQRCTGLSLAILKGEQDRCDEAGRMKEGGIGCSAEETRWFISAEDCMR